MCGVRSANIPIQSGTCFYPMPEPESFFLFKQKTAYELPKLLEFRRVLFRSAVNMGIMTRMGDVAWRQLGENDEFTRCLHSLGDVNPDRRFICHYPLDNTIWSFGSGYGGRSEERRVGKE